MGAPCRVKKGGPWEVALQAWCPLPGFAFGWGVEGFAEARAVAWSWGVSRMGATSLCSRSIQPGRSSHGDGYLFLLSSLCPAQGLNTAGPLPLWALLLESVLFLSHFLEEAKGTQASQNAPLQGRERPGIDVTNHVLGRAGALLTISK